MKILVYGTGAIGGYLGASLSQDGNDVTLIARQVTADAINEHGLTLARPGRAITVQPTVVTTVRQAFLQDQTYDLVLLTMKSYDVTAALNPFVAFCPQPPPTIMTLQNGIGIEKEVQVALPDAPIVSASVTTPVSREAQERMVVERPGRGVALAPIRPQQKIGPWLKLFRAAGINVQGVKDYRAMVWSKALVNMVGNATSAIVNRHPRMIYKYKPTFDLEMEMLRETLAVMKAQGVKVVNLPGVSTRQLAFAVKWLPRLLVQPILSGIVAEGRGDKLPSFHLDLTAGKKKNEVDYHNGAVARTGRELNVPTPVNEALNDILLKIAQKEVDWEVYNGNPKRLVQEVEKYR